LLAPVLLAGWFYVFVLAVRELGASIFLVGPGTHVLGTISLTMWEEGGSYGAVAALGVVQIVPLAVIVAGLRSVELAIQRRAQRPGGGPSRRRKNKTTSRPDPGGGRCAQSAALGRGGEIAEPLEVLFLFLVARRQLEQARRGAAEDVVLGLLREEGQVVD